MNLEHAIRRLVQREAGNGGHTQVAEVTSVDPLAVQLVHSGIELEEGDLQLSAQMEEYAASPGLTKGDLLVVLRQDVSGDILWLGIASA